MASLLAPPQAQMSSLSLAASRSQNVLSSSASVSFRGTAISAPRRIAATATPSAVAVRAQASAAAADAAAQERFRLNNLAPQPGSRRQEKRKGRGHAAGQGASCGFGMRGQKSRSGPGVRFGFEGGQMPLYRRLPKLKGIAGGMGAGLPKYVTLNVGDLEEMGLEEGEEVSLESLVEDGILNPSGRDRRLPLKILGDGEISTKDETILSAAIDAGLDLPHDCKLGVCMTCPAKLISVLPKSFLSQSPSPLLRLPLLVSAAPFIPLRLPLSVSLSVSPSFSPPLRLPLSVSQLRRPNSVSPSPSPPLHLPNPISPSPPPPLRLVHSVSHSSLALPLPLSVSPSPSLPLRRSLSVSSSPSPPLRPPSPFLPHCHPLSITPSPPPFLPLCFPSLSSPFRFPHILSCVSRLLLP
ncbi:unnamed protein product [Closterium sp. Naga37s-1]|nr:unnamed protein product [Closterium sp. Naga37s-1]